MITSSAICIAVTTHYPKWYRGKLCSLKQTDKIRGDLALQFVNKAVRSGYRIVVADSASTKTFRKDLNTIENVIVINRRSKRRSVGKRQAIKKASGLTGVKVIVLSEPEKISLIECIPKITHPLFNDQADIVIPKRDTKLFQQTYPDYMYQSEIEGNTAYNQILRKARLLNKKNPDLDMFFGPRAFVNKPTVISLFMRIFSLYKKNLFRTHLKPLNHSRFRLSLVPKRAQTRSENAKMPLLSDLGFPSEAQGGFPLESKNVASSISTARALGPPPVVTPAISGSGFEIHSNGQSYEAEDYSNTLFFPVIIALKKKIRVSSVTVPFRYPTIQKDNEEKKMRKFFIEKRDNQRISLLAELNYFISNRYRANRTALL